jgi:hypothetical protein
MVVATLDASKATTPSSRNQKPRLPFKLFAVVLPK